MKEFFAEFRRRHVFKVAGIYAAVSWVLVQGATMVKAPLFLPAWFDTFVIIVVLIGFPIALLLAWAFDLTPDGVRRTEPLPAGLSNPDLLHFSPSTPVAARTATGASGDAVFAAPTTLSAHAPLPAAPPARLPLPPRLVGASERSPFAFFGRRDELERLSEAQKGSVTEQRLRVTLISGEPGIGKTTLVAQAARAIHGTGANVLYGHCEEDLGVPYQPWSEALSQLVEHSDEALLRAFVDANGSALVRLVPALARRLAIPVPEVGSDADAERFLILEGVVRLLALASKQTPALLVLDDLHWVDAASLQLLRHLVASAMPMAVLVVGTFRESDLSRAHPLVGALADLRREPCVDRLGLHGLDDAEIFGLLATAADHEIEAEGVILAQALRRETGGNPFFVVAVVLHLLETGAFTQNATGRWELATDFDNLALPTSVREVVAHRVARLGELTEQALSAASVIGREFDLDLLTAVVDVNEAQLLNILKAAASAGIIMESESQAGRYRFLHALIQHTLYQDLGATLRQRAHQRIAEALEARGTDDNAPVEELARHWLAATRPTDATKALYYARRAGDAALVAYAPLDAVRWYTHALDLHDRHAQGNEHEHCELLTALGTAQRLAGQPEYRNTQRDAGRIALRLADRDLLVGIALSRAAGVDDFVEVDPGRLVVLQAALEAVGPADSGTRARLLACLAEESDPRDAIRRSELAGEAIDIARRTGDDATLVTVLTHALPPLETPDTLDRVLEETRVLLDLSEHSGDVWERFKAVSSRGMAVMETGDLGAFDAGLAAMEVIAERTGLPWQQWLFFNTRSWRHLLAGRTAEAEADSNAGLDVGTRSGLPMALLVYGAQLMQRGQQQGRLAEFVDVVAQELAKTPTLPALQMTLMNMYCELGRLEDCAALFDVGYAAGFSDLPFNIMWIAAVGQYADCAADMGRADAAPRLFALLSPYASRFNFHQVVDHGAAARPLGRLATMLGQFDDAETHLRAALALHERLHAPYWIARTQLDLGELAITRRDPTDAATARELIQQAQRGIDEFGYGGLTPRVERLLQRL